MVSDVVDDDLIGRDRLGGDYIETGPGLSGRSTEPAGEEQVTIPVGDVGESWPFVSP